MRKKIDYHRNNILNYSCKEKVFPITFNPCETIKDTDLCMDFKHNHHHHCNNNCFCSIPLQYILLIIIIIILIAYCNNCTSTPCYNRCI